MRHNKNYYNFKAEILRAMGLIFLSSSGLVFIEIFKQNFQMDSGLTTWLITSILIGIMGLTFLVRSLEILEETLGIS